VPDELSQDTREQFLRHLPLLDPPMLLRHAAAAARGHVLRDRDGNVIEGDPAKSEPVVDLWTFQRDTRAEDPNWVLVSTRTEA